MTYSLTVYDSSQCGHIRPKLSVVHIRNNEYRGIHIIAAIQYFPPGKWIPHRKKSKSSKMARTAEWLSALPFYFDGFSQCSPKSDGEHWEKLSKDLRHFSLFQQFQLKNWKLHKGFTIFFRCRGPPPEGLKNSLLFKSSEVLQLNILFFQENFLMWQWPCHVNVYHVVQRAIRRKGAKT